MVENLLKVIHILEGLQQAEHLRMLNMYRLFLAFPKTKIILKEKRFQTIDEIQENMMGQLMAIPTKDFAQCFER